MSQKVKEQILFSMCAMVCKVLESIDLRIKHFRSTVEVESDGESVIKRPKLKSRSINRKWGQDRCIVALWEGKFLLWSFSGVASAELFNVHPSYVGIQLSGPKNAGVWRWKFSSFQWGLGWTLIWRTKYCHLVTKWKIIYLGTSGPTP